jgi:hypothetical protein
MNVADAAIAKPVAESKSKKNLDVAEPSDELLATLIKYYDDSVDGTSESRKLAERDRDYYDGEQWSESERKVLENRKQPALVFNRIATKINYIAGDEILKRVDPKAYPRTPAHEDAAEAATDMLRYIDEQQGFDSLRSIVFENIIIEGAGGAVVEIEKNERITPINQSVTARPIMLDGKTGLEIEGRSSSQVTVDIDVKLRHVPWDRLFWDPHSRRHDFSDAKYVGIVTWFDHDDALSFYPDAEDVLTNTRDQGDGNTYDDRPPKWSDDKRNRIKIIETYWWDRGRCMVAHYTGGGFVRNPQPTGFLDEKGKDECPLIMTSCFVGRRNQRYGLVRPMISPQDAINQRNSKALHRLNTRQVIAEGGVVDDVETARAEIAKPDCWLEVRPGGLASMQFQDGGAIAQTELAMVEAAKAEIDAVGTLGQVMMDPSASGIAQRIRQKAASVPLEKVMDHLRQWTKDMYVAMWHRVRQFVTDEKWMRVTDDTGKNGYRFVGVNRLMTRAERLKDLLGKQVPIDSALTMLGAPEAVQAHTEIAQILGERVQQSGQQVPPEAIQQAVMAQLMALPMMQVRMTVNALDQLDVDIIIEESPDTTVIQQEEFEVLGQAVQNIGPLLPPAAAQKMLELLFEASTNLRGKKQILEAMRKPPEQNPQAMQAAQLQLAEKQQDVRRTASQADLAAAQAQKTQAETQLLPVHASVAQAEAQATTARTAAQVQAMPAKMMRDQAAAMNDAANAGAATLPTAPTARPQPPMEQGEYQYG